MSKRTAIITVIVVITLALVALAIFYFFYLNGGEGAPESQFPTGGQNEPPPRPAAPPAAPAGPKTPAAFKPVLRQVSTAPTGGGVVFESGGKRLIRYIERGKGNVYETEAENIKPFRLTNALKPKIYESFWKADGGAVLARFLKEGTEQIQSFYGKISQRGGGEGDLTGNFILPNMKSVAQSPSTDKIFFLLTSSLGASGVISNIDGGRKLQVFSSPLNDWLASWPKESLVTLTTKPSAGSVGSLLFLNPSTGGTEEVLRNIRGLTTLTSPDGAEVLYSASTDGGLDTRIFSLKTGTGLTSALKTLPEKCVWSRLEKNAVFCAVPETLPAADYPDSWYQGRTAFADEVWKLNTKTGRAEFIMNLRDSGRTAIDVLTPSMDGKEVFFLFTNKNDLTLWELQIKP
jgi:hypothetical protein